MSSRAGSDASVMAMGRGIRVTSGVGDDGAEGGRDGGGDGKEEAGVTACCKVAALELPAETPVSIKCSDIAGGVQGLEALTEPGLVE